MSQKAMLPRCRSDCNWTDTNTKCTHITFSVTVAILTGSRLHVSEGYVARISVSIATSVSSYTYTVLQHSFLTRHEAASATYIIIVTPKECGM